jgi:hypothetical protein
LQENSGAIPLVSYSGVSVEIELHEELACVLAELPAFVCSIGRVSDTA